MNREERLYLEWSAKHPKEDALLLIDVQEPVGIGPVMVDCGMLGPQPVIPPAVRRRREDPNP